MDNTQNIQWFPGHMAKTKRQIEGTVKIIDAVVEIVDARIPISSRNPDLMGIIGNKPHIILLNKADMADQSVTNAWIKHFNSIGISAIPVDCKTGKGINLFKDTVKTALADKLASYRQKGMAGKPLRVMAVGIPNVGKSSFINKIVGNNRAKVENRPGVTRSNQWFTVDRELELLDTPGVLWPKFDDNTVGEHLAFTGAVTDRILDTELLAMRLLELLIKFYPQMLMERFKLTEFYDEPYDNLCLLAKKRGMMMRGAEPDTERAAAKLLEEFRNCKLGRITLEVPDA
ncbi:MAG: ribosome biogenesis GTPase YlqF [Clostridia bacterium]|nr:ribosome biogenesis GTPase YlqF [Clostridia bacterium]